MIIHIKATEQYFPVVLYITLYKVVLTFESVHKILKCDHSNESYCAVLSCGAVYYAVQDGSSFEPVDEISKVSIQSYSEHFMVPGSLFIFLKIKWFY